MAGTDRTEEHRTAESRLGGPAVILVGPQLGQNIGAAARAMLNFGLTDLRLVRPRDGWPSETAEAAASGADAVLAKARVFESSLDAAADIQHLFAATTRRRDMLKPVVTPRRAAEEMRRFAARGESTGVLFGPEQAGLDNDDVALADTVLTAPMNPAFSSLNLAQAVLLVGYEWFLAGGDGPQASLEPCRDRPATKAELEGLFRQLEDELSDSGFLQPPEKAPRMARNLRNIFQRAGLMEREVRTLRGVVASLGARRRRG